MHFITGKGHNILNYFLPYGRTTLSFLTKYIKHKIFIEFGMRQYTEHTRYSYYTHIYNYYNIIMLECVQSNYKSPLSCFVLLNVKYTFVSNYNNNNNEAEFSFSPSGDLITIQQCFLFTPDTKPNAFKHRSIRVWYQKLFGSAQESPLEQTSDDFICIRKTKKICKQMVVQQLAKIKDEKSPNNMTREALLLLRSSFPCSENSNHYNNGTCRISRPLGLFFLERFILL